MFDCCLRIFSELLKFAKEAYEHLSWLPYFCWNYVKKEKNDAFQTRPEIGMSDRLILWFVTFFKDGEAELARLCLPRFVWNLDAHLQCVGLGCSWYFWNKVFFSFFSKNSCICLYWPTSRAWIYKSENQESLSEINKWNTPVSWCLPASICSHYDCCSNSTMQYRQVVNSSSIWRFRDS